VKRLRQAAANAGAAAGNEDRIVLRIHGRHTPVL
jgi:hypothetical protein